MNRMRHFVMPGPTAALGAALCAGALFLASCTGPNHPSRIGESTVRSVSTSTQGHAELDDGVVQFRSRGPIDVIVESIGGDVEVRADPTIEVTTVQIVREAHHGYLRGTEPYEALSFVDWSADLVPGPGPVETLMVETVYSGPEIWYMRTHILVVTPELDRVRVRTVRGSVTVRNNTGPVDIETTEGDALVATSHPLRDANKIIVTEGDVDYRVPRGSSGEFNVEVIDGQIKTRITEGHWRYMPGANRTDLIRARLNNGTNPVLIRTTDGDVRISVVKNPLGYGPIRSEA